MNFNRKILLPIKQLTNFNLVKGVVKLTADSESATLLATFTSLKYNLNDLTITVYDGINFIKIKVKNGVAITLNEGFNVNKITGVIFVYANGSYDKIGYFSNIEFTSNEALSLVENHYRLLTTETENEKTNDYQLRGEYDDEAISSYNYYENALFDKTNDFNGENCNKAQEEGSKPTRYEYETYANKIENDNLFSSNTERREKLEKLLNDYPYHKPLSELLPNAKFIAVNYDSDNEYYVGITTILNVSYACVAVKGYYGKKALENSFFIPLSQLNYEGEGYFVSFSNLETGETAENLLQLF